MQEISPNVYIETGYAGVTLGAINLGHGLVLIDAPFLAEDIRSWRSSLISLGGGVDRMLINQDTHIDRIMGASAMECTIVGHEDLAKIFQTRPFPYRSQSLETGAEWELFDNQGTTRWAPPELSFSQEMKIHWGNTPIFLEHCPGGESGALWVHMPEERVLFLGDLVVHNQPPFMANTYIPAWIETLEKVLEPEFKNYTLVGGRNGLVRREHVRWQIRFLDKVQKQLEGLKERNAPESEIEKLAPKLLKDIEHPQNRENLYLRRLKWGLSVYYLKNYFPENLKEIEE
jgi:glyoxylase-like metal-dependent hydrolase (beta-lactamase superfamily II)